MTDYPCFCVAPVREQKLCLSLAQKQVIAAYMRRMDGKDVRVTFSQPTKGRSNNQNRYMWGVVYTMIAAETGHTTEEIHEFMKSKFLPREYVQLGSQVQQLTKSTTVLSTFGMEEYLEQVRAFAGNELSLSIPLPNEIELPTHP